MFQAGVCSRPSDDCISFTGNAMANVLTAAPNIS
jgi:hypothetical protein